MTNSPEANQASKCQVQIDNDTDNDAVQKLLASMAHFHRNIQVAKFDGVQRQAFDDLGLELHGFIKSYKDRNRELQEAHRDLEFLEHTLGLCEIRCIRYKGNIVRLEDELIDMENLTNKLRIKLSQFVHDNNVANHNSPKEERYTSSLVEELSYLHTRIGVMRDELERNYNFIEQIKAKLTCATMHDYSSIVKEIVEFLVAENRSGDKYSD